MPATFVRRERKHRRLAKQKEANGSVVRPQEDVNRDIILPADSALHDARRRQLQAELAAQATQGKLGSKKRKRLDHYIETKLKKEENAERIRRLASQHVDTSLLQSSKTLGRVHESKRDTFRRALKEREAGIDSYGDQQDVLYTSKSKAVSLENVDADASTDEESLEHDEKPLEREEKHESLTTQPVLRPLEGGASVRFGAGLKAAVNGDTPAPIRRRKRRKLGKPASPSPQASEMEDDESDGALSEHMSDWLGFASDNEARTSDSSGEDELAADDDGSSIYSASSDTTVDTDADQPQRSRSSAFKQWAESQRNQALDFQPNLVLANDPALLAAFKPRQASPEPLAELQIPASVQDQRTLKAIVIERDSAIQSAREALPIVQEEQRLMEAINRHPIVIICGATGSGKTTQIPQMMMESGYGTHCGETNSTENTESWTLESKGMIGITQPRRVAALAVAERVKVELGRQYAAKVAHHVRYDTNTSKLTTLKFMTDGILLRELQQDFILSRYSAIIIDEAHERSVNTDILIGTLSRIVSLRAELTKEDPKTHFPLKLVIMSATLRVADFAKNERLFRGLAPPIIETEGRQYNVTIHFARKTHRDYEGEMVRKISKAHRKLPPGSILAFLTGQNEIVSVMAQLQQALGAWARTSVTARTRISSDQLPLEADDMDVRQGDDAASQDDLEVIRFDDADDDNDDDQDLDIEPDADEAKQNVSTAGVLMQARLLPLYAALPAEQQLQVFKPSQPGERLIILATNVAETSLTIPGVRYIFDCGRSKEKKYDTTTGISSFEVDWISKASAAQRTGRAGRTGPGHCWRLYSSALYEEHFPEHSVPEILRTPVESIVLSLKAMDIDNVSNFPFPTPPDRAQLRNAERLLCNLGAIHRNGKLTEQGRELMQYPLNPRYGKILLLAARNKIVEHAIALVAALAVGEIFLPDALAHTVDGSEAVESDTQRSYGRAQSLLSRWDDHSDAIKMLTAVAVHAEAVSKDSIKGGRHISHELFLREKGMAEVQQLRTQLRSILRAQSRHAAPASSSAALTLPTPEQRKKLDQTVTAAFIDQVAIRADLLPNAGGLALQKPRRANEVPYVTLSPTDATHAASHVFVHSSSVLARLSKDEMPSYVVYSHLTRAAPKAVTDDTVAARVRMHPLTTVSGKVLTILAQDTPMLRIGKPIGKIQELDAGKRRICWVRIALQATSSVDGSSGGTEWPMPAWEVEQVRQRNGEWTVTKVISR